MEAAIVMLAGMLAGTAWLVRAQVCQACEETTRPQLAERSNVDEPRVVGAWLTSHYPPKYITPSQAHEIAMVDLEHLSTEDLDQYIALEPSVP